jgi:membrane-associated phospholipid phosphatase
MVFVRLRAIADETAIAVQYDYPIAFEKTIFGGNVLNVWLQDLLYVPGRISPLDVILAAVYFSYFLAPPAMSLLLWRIRPSLFPRFAWALILAFTISLVLFFAIPTAPPWLASENGHLGTVHRVIPPFTAALAGDAYKQAAATFDKNAVAAMPSLHVALTVVVAAVMSQFGRNWRRLGVAYVAAMCFALIYLGEHYVIDEIAGLILGFGVWQVTGRFTGRAPTRVRDAETSGARLTVNREPQAVN